MWHSLEIIYLDPKDHSGTKKNTMCTKKQGFLVGPGTTRALQKSLLWETLFKNVLGGSHIVRAFICSELFYSDV